MRQKRPTKPGKTPKTNPKREKNTKKKKAIFFPLLYRVSKKFLSNPAFLLFLLLAYPLLFW